jgi:hypothetical protein
MYPQKFEKEGKRFVKFGEIEAELAPIEVIKKIVEKHKIEKDFELEYTKETEVLGKVNLNGWVKAPAKAGNYLLSIQFYDKEQEYSEETYIGYVKVGEAKKFLTAQEVINTYTKVFGERAKGTLWLTADSKYKKARLTDIRAILQETKIDQLPYKAEGTDCDDFANALMGAFHADPYKPEWKPTAKQAIFIVWVWWKDGDTTYAHALCSATDGDSVWMIEPQNDAIFKVPSNWHLWLLMG